MRAQSFVLILVSALQGLAAQPERPAAAAAELRAAADAAWRARDYAEVVKTCTELTKAEPADGLAWHHLGYALHALGRLDEALVVHQKTAELPGAAPEVVGKATYNVACVHALQGRKDEALRWLELAVQRGFRMADHIARDTDLDAIRGEPRFVKLLAGLTAARKKVAIVVHEGVELLDFAGPTEAFAAARRGGDRCYEVFLVAPNKKPLKSQGCVTIVPQHDITDCPRPDVVVIPGGDTDQLLRDEAFMTWVKTTSTTAEVMMSVCTGAFALAKAGLLDGGPATTHHGSIAGLRRDFPKVEVRDDARFVDNGKTLTSAGVSAGIDGALHLIERQMGADVARATARYMEYRWTYGADAEAKPATAQPGDKR